MLEAKQVVKAVVGRLGLGRVARRIQGSLQITRSSTPLVPIKEFTASCELAIRTLRMDDHAFGDYLEFGVSRGTSMVCMARALSEAGLHHVRLIGFDSFQGMPPEAATQGWEPGLYASPIRATRAHLSAEGVDPDRVELVKGWFKDTLNQRTAEELDLRKASLIMIDCDIYSASKEALWFVEPLIGDEAVIIFDDWGWLADINEIGQREAYAEFLEAFPRLDSEPLPAYRPEARMFKVTGR